MRIISKYQDYYDYVPRLYGRGEVDNLVIFGRNKGIDGTVEKTVWSKDYEPRVLDRDKFFNTDTIQYRVFVICGAPFLLYRPYNYCDRIADHRPWRLFSKEECPEFYAYLNKRWWGKDIVKMYDASRLFEEEMKPVEFFVSEAKKFNTPIYEIDSNGRVSDTLLIKDTPLTAYLRPELLYQTIEAFIMEHLRPNPDLMKPIHVPDEQKAQNKGFDKFSFRKAKSVQ